jgi:hypothetical protein
MCHPATRDDQITSYRRLMLLCLPSVVKFCGMCGMYFSHHEQTRNAAPQRVAAHPNRHTKADTHPE